MRSVRGKRLGRGEGADVEGGGASEEGACCPGRRQKSEREGVRGGESEGFKGNAA